jgi:hypothetical protein
MKIKIVLMKMCEVYKSRTQRQLTAFNEIIEKQEIFF